ncbi:MAG TPA: hypothetical protein QGG93_09875, partial [Verrucomicrobiota bacterium]|nr:hypothetical protein [Verrucomicrobiota bacterium]
HLGKAGYYPETQGFDVNIGGTYWGAPATFFHPYRGHWTESDPELRYVPVGRGSRAITSLTNSPTTLWISLSRNWINRSF